MIGRLQAGLGSALQLLLITIFDLWYRARRSTLPSVSWVVGPNEVANMVAQFAAAVPGSVTAVIVNHPFYAGPYDFHPPEFAGKLSAFRWRWLTLPALFVRLAHSAQGFVYLSQNGYLQNLRDGREYEFGFLRRRGVKVVCCFTGSDIRSPVLMREHERVTGLPNIASYLGYTNPVFQTPAYDAERKRTGEVAERFADEIFTFRVDQMGYLTRRTQPFPYLVPDEELEGDLSRFDAESPPVVLHAPSSPIIKGTQLVRSAVAALREEGFAFEYVELTGVPHEQVKQELARAHVVMNEFYSHAPGVFAVEAMAAGCVVLTSADEHVERDLPAGSNEAWVVTKHWEVYRNLRAVLERPEAMRAQAEAGLAWVRRHATASASGARIRSVLDDLTASHSSG